MPTFSCQAERLNDNPDPNNWEPRTIKAWDVRTGDFLATPNGIFRVQRIEDKGDGYLKFIFSDDPREAPPNCTTGPRKAIIYIRKSKPIKNPSWQSPQVATRRKSPQVATRRKSPQVATRRKSPQVATKPKPKNKKNRKEPVMLFPVKDTPLKVWRVAIQRDGIQVSAGIATARTQGGALATVPKELRAKFPVTVTLSSPIATGRKGCTLLPHIQDLIGGVSRPPAPQ